MKKKNDAIDKVEKIADENKKNTSGDYSGNYDEQVIEAFGGTPYLKEIKKEKNDSDARVAKALETERKRAERKKQKARKTEFKKRAAEMKKKERERKKADCKNEKEKLAAAKKARNLMLKNETKSEKAARLAAEKQARLSEKEKKKYLKAEANRLRLYKRRQKLERKLERKHAFSNEARSKNVSSQNDKGVGGWVAAVVSLGSVVLILATLFTLSLTTQTFGNDKQSGMTAQAYYDFVDYVDAMDTGLSKALVSSDEKNVQKILTEVTAQANLAAADLARLPISDENKFYTVKFVNQVGDYSKYLINRLIDGYSLTETDKETLKKLYEINNELKRELMKATAEAGEKYDFDNMNAETKDDALLNVFSAAEERSAEYPELIYDGPFSDGLKSKKAKGLTGEEVSLTKAEENFKKYFADYVVDNVEAVGEKNDKIKTYDFESKIKNGGALYAEVSKLGGELIFFDCYDDCSEANYDLDYCIETGAAFISGLGIKGMYPVWATENGSVAYINYAFELDGVIVYPDMIKVTVCKERGIVSAFDAREYYLNHVSRKIPSAVLSENEAIKKCSTLSQIESVRLALIPKGNDDEVLTYECSGKVGDSTFYVYVDAFTGREVKIFKVVETLEGKLLA